MRLIGALPLFVSLLPGQVEHHHPSAAGLVDLDAEIETLGRGMQFTEGPVWLPQEQALVFSDIPRGKLMRWTAASGVEEWRDSEQSNGNARGPQGRLFSCQHAARNLVRYGPGGEVKVLASQHDGKPLNSPNDLVLSSAGNLWFTDPTYGLRGRQRAQSGNYVYYLPRGGAPVVVQREFDMPNGVCLSPSEATLYVADSGEKQRIGAFAVRSDGTLSEPLFWIPGGADGLRCDAGGNLYAAARDGVRVYSEQGVHLATIRLPEVPANLAFGGADRRDLFVTARTGLYRVRVRAGGPVLFASNAWTAQASDFRIGGVYEDRFYRGYVPIRRSVRAGLDWLARHQDEDGKWDCDRFMKHDAASDACDGAGREAYDVGVTALALLAFLGDGHTLRVGGYKDVVKKAVVWLRSQQQEDGRFGVLGAPDWFYGHAMATCAIVEAYDLSFYKLLKPCAERGLAYLQAHRGDGAAWRYGPGDARGDLSVTGWAVLALQAAEAAGLEADSAWRTGCGRWLDEVSDATGLHGYTKRGEPSSRLPGDHGRRFPVSSCEPLTAIGVVCRAMLGQEPTAGSVMDAAADRLVSKPPVWSVGDGRADPYYWFWASDAMRQVGGVRWRAWRRALEAAAVPNQRRSAQGEAAAGSWDPVGPWGEVGGRVYSTALMSLALESSYRRAPERR
jgi:gluconolactonase